MFPIYRYTCISFLKTKRKDEDKLSITYVFGFRSKTYNKPVE